MGIGLKGSPPSILFIGAFAPEISHLRKFEGQEIPVFPGVMLETLECGIGNISALLALLKRAGQGGIREAIFVGSCGLYEGEATSLPEWSETLRVFSTDFYRYDLSSSLGMSRSPDFLEKEIHSRSGEAAELLRDALDAADVSVNSLDYITLRDFPSPIWKGVGVENMECFGLAVAAREARISLSAILAVTNVVGPEGSSQWSQRHARMADLLQADILRTLGFTQGV